MVDVRMSNEKLQERARRIVRTAVPPKPALDVQEQEVLDMILARCDGHVKLSILVAALGCTPEEGKARLDRASGSLREALKG